VKKIFAFLLYHSKLLLATWRLNEALVCEMSRGRGLYDDFHDYRDESDFAGPWHGYTYHCSRCGKEFQI
jgi:hypothetical protein